MIEIEVKSRFEKVKRVRGIKEIESDIVTMGNKIDELELEKESCLKNNKTLQKYLERKTKYDTQINEIESELHFLNKLIYLEEFGVDTDELLKNVCKEDCESYKLFGWKDSCMYCGNNYENLLTTAYEEEYNQRNPSEENELPF